MATAYEYGYPAVATSIRHRRPIEKVLVRLLLMCRVFLARMVCPSVCNIGVLPERKPWYREIVIVLPGGKPRSLVSSETGRGVHCQPTKLWSIAGQVWRR